MVIKNKQGWTLTEVMIVVAVVGIIASMAPTIMNQITRVFILNKTKLELQQQARAAMYIITRELRQAQTNTIIIDRANGSQFHYSRLRFTKVGGQTHSYYQNGNQLLLTVGNTTTTISKNLAYVAFTFPRSDDMTIISVSMTLQQQIYGGQYRALHMASERVRVMN